MDAGPSAPMATLARDRLLLDQAQAHVYKKTGSHELHAHVFLPPNSPNPPARRAAILFFYSSTWDHGLASQFVPHCLHFSRRGLVAITCDYRAGARYGAGPLEAMADARSAIRWIRSQADEWQIDPQKIIGSGGSGGAHAMLTAAMAGPGFDDPSDLSVISPAPDALVLFEPIVDTDSSLGYGRHRFPDKKIAALASPMRLIRRGLPPMIIFHGSHDRLINHKATQRFAKKMTGWFRRNDCRLETYGGCGHSFFNFNVDARLYEETLVQADRFLVDRGFLSQNEDDMPHRLSA
jgi:acetyl esterase